MTDLPPTAAKVLRVLVQLCLDKTGWPPGMSKPEAIDAVIELIDAGAVKLVHDPNAIDPDGEGDMGSFELVAAAESLGEAQALIAARDATIRLNRAERRRKRGRR